jgi:hypothetical protein
MDVKDHYAALAVDRAETLQGIHAAYRRLAKQCHPDHAGKQGTEQFQAIQEAYEVLSDPVKRRAYDAQLDRWHAMGGTSGIKREPPIPLRRSSRGNVPEPLISPSPPPEDLCAPLSAHWAGCHPLNKRRREEFCYWCHQCELPQCHRSHLIVSWLLALRGDRW